MFTWHVIDDQFATVKQLDSTSEVSWKAIAEWLKNTNFKRILDEQRNK